MSVPIANVTHVQARISITHRVWEMTAFLVVTGGMLAAGGWYCLAYSDTDQLALLPRQVNALVVSSVIYTNLAVIGAFGLGSLYSGDGTMLGLFAILLWNHFVLSLLSGAFLLVAMLQGDPAMSGSALNECANHSVETIVQAFCRHNFEQMQNIAVGTTAAMWIIQFTACIMTSRFVSLISKEEDESSIYAGPEAATFWTPQLPRTPLSSLVTARVTVAMQTGEEEEYKTPMTAEFSRFAWV